MTERGKYVVIEGNDGTGKSTHVEMLSDYLNGQGIGTFIAHEPAGTPVADAIRTVIKDGSLERDAETNLLLFTASRHEIWRRAEQELALGKWVLSARNYYSTLAYQGKGEGLSEDLIISTTRQFVGDDYMNPDTMLILTLDDEPERAKRVNGRGRLENPDTFESRDAAFQARVNQAYIDLARERGIQTLDAGRSVDDIQADIRKIISEK